MKRVFCMLLVVAMLLSLMPAVGLQAAATSYTEEVFVSPCNYRIGDAIPAAENIPVQVEGGTVRSVSGFVNESDGQPATGVFEKNKKYRLTVEVESPEGTIYPEMYGPICPDVETYSIIENGQILRLTFLYDFSYRAIAGLFLVYLPSEIQPGPAEIPPVKMEDQADVTGVRWLSSDKEPVDTLELGKDYFLEVTVTARCNAHFGYYQMENGDEAELSQDSQVLTYYKYYSLIPEVGEIKVTTDGIGEGQPFDGVTAAVEGDAVLENITVTDKSAGSTVVEGTFASGKQYAVRFALRPAEGYQFGDGTTLMVDGAEPDWSIEDGAICFTKELSTMQELDAVTLSMTKVEVGKKPADIVVTAPADVDYEVVSWSWKDADGANVTKFEKGNAYLLSFIVRAVNGHIFTEDSHITVNGQELYDLTIYNSGKNAEGMVYVSFLTEITKVSLPAMPKSVKKNATLSTDYKVSSSAKYEMMAAWVAMSTQEVATKASKNDCYMLTYIVAPKDGYEFTENTKFYVGSTKVEPILYSSYYAQIMKPYNVGLTEIKRVDLTVAEPVEGATPGLATVSAAAPYTLAEQGWGMNSTGKLESGSQEVETFVHYQYHFLAAALQPKAGYCFANAVSVYVNGVKYAVVEEYNLGVVYQAAVCFGKLGEIQKLTAPKLTKDGETLCWEPVKNADRYEIYRATSKSGKYTKVAEVAANTWVDETATDAKTYYYKVKGVHTADLTKISDYSGYVSVDYKCAEPVITVENGSSGKPVVSWEKVSGAKKYTVYRATSETGKYTKLGTTTKLTYTDSKAKAGTTCYYKVIANASSSKYSSGYSEIQSCYVICGTPAVTIKIDAASGKPILSWKKIDGAVKYEVYLLGAEDYVTLGTVTGTSFKDESCYAGEGRYYGVRAIASNTLCNSQVSDAIFGRANCAQPKLSSGVNSLGQPRFDWQQIEGAVKYEVYRSTKSTKGYTLLATVEDGNAYADASAAPGKTYYYKVVAIGENCKSAESAYVKLTGKCAAPNAQAQTDEATGKPIITWEKVTGAKKYTVYRATSKDGKYSKLGTTTKLSYTDTKATVGTTYFYKVIANGSSSKYSSGYSNAVSAQTRCATPEIQVSTVAATGQPTLSWKKVTGAVRYEIWLEQAGAKEQLATTTQLTFTDENVYPGEARIYWVYAVDAQEGKIGAWVVGTAACGQPKLTGTNASNGKPQLNWAPVEYATQYVIYRSTKKSSGYTEIDRITDVNFTDVTALRGKTYYYQVAAVCGESESAKSAYVKVTCKASTRKTSVSTCKDTGKSTVWDYWYYEGNRYDLSLYEERDPERFGYLNYILSPTYSAFYYLEEDTMKMTAGRTYGMPIVTSPELVRATIWASSDPTVATVNDVGFVTALKGGTTVITATLVDPESQTETVRTCYVTVEEVISYTYAQLEAKAKVEAKAIADYVMAYPGLTLDMERIALAAKIINEVYVAKGKGASIYEIKNDDLVEVMIAGYNQPYGTLVTFHSSCAGDTRALGMVLEYMGFEWCHVNENKWVHQWCIVYDVDGQTAFADGSMYGMAGYGERAEDGSNWLQFQGDLIQIP